MTNIISIDFDRFNQLQSVYFPESFTDTIEHKFSSPFTVSWIFYDNSICQQSHALCHYSLTILKDHLFGVHAFNGNLSMSGQSDSAIT